MSVPMSSSPSPEASTSPQPLTGEVHRRFAHFRDRHPHSSFTSVLESGPTGNAAGPAEYIVRATISLEGRPLVSSLAAAPSLEEAEDLARLRNLALAEAIITAGPHDGTAAPVSSGVPFSAPPRAESMANSAPSQSAMDYGSDDGLGDTLINLGPLAGPEGSGLENNAPEGDRNSTAARSKKPKPKPKPKKSAAVPATPHTAVEASSESPAPDANAIEAETQPAQEFVADWSEDLAQISVELKRLNWDSKQEQEYLERTFSKSSRDDIIDHGELMDYLGYLQALPSHFEETVEAEDSPIADTGLSVDEADLAPKSVSELIASAGLKSGAEIPAPPTAVAPTVTEAELPEAPTEDPASPDNDTIVREPEPEIEIADDGPDEEPDLSDLEEAEPQTTATSLTRSEMMDETARLCKQLGWKNRQGSDFLKATYNKPTRKDLTDAEMMDFLEQLRSLSTTEALPY